MEKKTDKENHIKGFGGQIAPEASQGKINSGRFRDTRDVCADACGNSNSRGRTSAGQTGHTTGQMGHVHGTDGHTPGGVPSKFVMFIGFSFPIEFPKTFVQLSGVLHPILAGINSPRKCWCMTQVRVINLSSALLPNTITHLKIILQTYLCVMQV